MALREFDQSLSDAQTRDQRWIILSEGLQNFGFAEIHWFADGKNYHKALQDVAGQESWTVRVPLNGEDFIDCIRTANADDSSLNVGALVAVLRKALSSSAETVNIVSLNGSAFGVEAAGSRFFVPGERAQPQLPRE